MCIPHYAHDCFRRALELYHVQEESTILVQPLHRVFGWYTSLWNTLTRQNSKNIASFYRDPWKNMQSPVNADHFDEELSSHPHIIGGAIRNVPCVAYAPEYWVHNLVACKFDPAGSRNNLAKTTFLISGLAYTHERQLRSGYQTGSSDAILPSPRYNWSGHDRPAASQLHWRFHVAQFAQPCLMLGGYCSLVL